MSSCSEDEIADDAVGSIAPFETESDLGEPIKVKLPLESRKKWKILNVSSFQPKSEAKLLIDNKPGTHWHTPWGKALKKPPHEVSIDMGEELELHGFTYLPRQVGGMNGTIKEYEFFVSLDSENWGEKVSSGNFNCKKTGASLQFVEFKPVKARYIKLVSLKEFNNKPWASCAELNVIIEE